MKDFKNFQKYVNNILLKEASLLNYTVSEFAPNSFKDLKNSTSLVIWNGESENTIFGDASVNWALRALHDNCHLNTNLKFTPEQEIELGRIQASHFEKRSQLLADLIYIETAEQAKYFQEHGDFVKDQFNFTLNKLIKIAK